MSTQSSSITSHYDDDDNCSCDSYSSGWERSSVSDEYWGSTSTEEKDDDFCAMGEFYVPPQQTTGIKIFDLEYKCDLVVLPHPYKKKDIGRDDEKPVFPLPSPQSVPSSPVCVNPWKKIETEGCVEEDPWKFLEAKKEVPPPPPPAPKAVAERKKQVIDNSNTNKLCKYKGDCRRMNRHHSCTMVHSLAEWKPRICRFNNGCRRKSSCGYYHTETSLKEYLRVMIATKDSIYAKNSALYEKYL
jgi:hypothetical protein